MQQTPSFKVYSPGNKNKKGRVEVLINRISELIDFGSTRTEIMRIITDESSSEYHDFEMWTAYQAALIFSKESGKHVSTHDDQPED